MVTLVMSLTMILGGLVLFRSRNLYIRPEIVRKLGESKSRKLQELITGSIVIFGFVILLASLFTDLL
ncbi:MAG: hypothetical protein JNK26_04175 [Candidatus Doudnabacteria bacterium]|nr:hypothetical protein [Candidatus Doudnabacteria bacterium]